MKEKPLPKIGSYEWWQMDVDSPPAVEVVVKPKAVVKQAYVFRPTPKLCKEAKGYVYYVFDGYDRVKIGFSTNPWSRVKENRTFNPSVEVVAIEKGTRALEDRRHEQFKDEHIVREWYRLSDRLSEWMGLVDAPHYLAKRGSEHFTAEALTA